jgi:hypothetical protein
MSFARERVRTRTVFVTASHVLSVRSCWENVCGSMVLGVSSTQSIQMDRVLHLAVFTEIRGTRIQMNRVHRAVFISRGTRRITSRKNVKPLFYSGNIRMVFAVKQDCIICFEQKICPPLSYGCCHFDICLICLERWKEVNHGIERCPICREIQFEKPFQVFCFRCRRPTHEQRHILFKVFFAQIIFIFVVLFVNEVNKR